MLTSSDQLLLLVTMWAVLQGEGEVPAPFAYPPHKSAPPAFCGGGTLQGDDPGLHYQDPTPDVLTLLNAAPLKSPLISVWYIDTTYVSLRSAGFTPGRQRLPSSYF